MILAGFRHHEIGKIISDIVTQLQLLHSLDLSIIGKAVPCPLLCLMLCSTLMTKFDFATLESNGTPPTIVAH